MSLNPVSYLQTWEHNLAAARHRYQSLHVESESDGPDETYHDLPESSSSSASFLSRFSENSLGHRLNIYPYAGDEAYVRSHEASPVRALNSADDQETSPKTKGAYEVSHRKRIVQVLVALISCFLSSGVIFGFAALKPILIKEGVYNHLCDKELQGTVCYGQELRLNLMFAVASGTFNVSIFPVGAFLNVYGPRTSSILGSLSLIFGSMLLAFAPNIPFDAYIPGYLFLAIGGSLIYISSLHLSNAFPKYSTLIYLATTGAFNSSSAVFLIFRYISTKTNGQFSTRLFFLVYLIVPVLILVMQFFVMPRIAYKTPAELVLQVEGYATAESSDCVDGVIPDPAEAHRIHRQNTIRTIQAFLHDDSVNLSHTRIAVFGTGPFDPGYLPQIQPPRGLSKDSSGIIEGSLSKQIRSSWLLLMAIFAVFQMVKLNYIIASLYQQYESLLSPDRASQINQVFDILLPIGGILCIPLISALDRTNHSSIVISLMALATAIGVIGCIPALWAGYMNIILYAFYRPFFLAGISDYVAKVFGLRTYAIVYGLAISLSGVGNFAMPGLDALTFKHFGGNPIPVNMALTGAIFVTGTVLIWFVLSRSPDKGRERQESVERNDVPRVDTDEDEAEPDLETGPLLHRRSSHGKRRYGSTDI